MTDNSISAFIITGNHIADLQPLTADFAGAMSPLLDRPWLQHFIESLINHGIRKFHLFISDHPTQIEKHFEDGQRWGAEIVYHLGGDEEALFRQLKVQAAMGKSARTVLCQANIMFFDLPDLTNLSDKSGFKVVTAENAAVTDCWYVFTPESLKKAVTAGSFQNIDKALNNATGSANLAIYRSNSSLPMNSLQELLAAQKRVLQNEFPQLLCNASEVEPGIRLARNVSISPGAVIEAPAFIGENSQIGEKAKIGAGTTIGSNCIIDNSSTFENALVFPGSYVGEGLNVRNSIIKQNRLINLDIGGEIYLAEEFILGSLADNWLMSMLFTWFWRITALTLLIISLPLSACVALILLVFRGRQGVFQVKEFVKTPAKGNSGDSTGRLLSFSSEMLKERTRPYYPPAHFCIEFLPGLISVIKGEIDLVGLPARSPDQVKRLTPSHRRLFLKARTGLISELQVYWQGFASSEEMEIADTHQCARNSFGANLRLLGRYFLSMFSLPLH